MNRFKQKKISSLKRKSLVCNGLTAEGLASPLVRVTRLRQKWVHHQSVWRGGGREKNPPKTITADIRASSPPLGLSPSRRSPPRSISTSPIQETRRTAGNRRAFRSHEGPHARTSTCKLVLNCCRHLFGWGGIHAVWNPRKAEIRVAAGATVVVPDRRSHFVRYPLGVRVNRHQILALINDRTSVIPAQTLLFWRGRRGESL